MYPHTKFGFPTSKNLGDMHRAGSGTDGQCNYYMPPKVPLGHKNKGHNLKKLGKVALGDAETVLCFPYYSLCKTRGPQGGYILATWA